jgi:hypothetical protein
MKSFIYTHPLLFLSLIAFLVLGCKKEESANPQDVKSKTLSVTSWSYSSPQYYVDLEVSDLTSEKLSTAAVMVYFSYSANNWIALPYTQYNDLAANYFMGFNTQVKNVQITWIKDTESTAGVNPNEYFGVDAVEFKIVVIPAATSRINSDLDLTDYEAVKTRFDLE